jgi:hypothetical protein
MIFEAGWGGLDGFPKLYKTRGNVGALVTHWSPGCLFIHCTSQVQVKSLYTCTVNPGTSLASVEVSFPKMKGIHQQHTHRNLYRLDKNIDDESCVFR